MSAYSEGYEAAERGEWWTTCPYPGRSEQMQQWLWGWDAGPSVPEPRQEPEVNDALVEIMLSSRRTFIDEGEETA